MRIGHGVDAHRLVPGRPLMLGGVAVPHDRGLEGHSDGDAVCHALGDAVLGAAGLGDLGRHFPSSDERWRGIAGADLLRRCAELARRAGFGVASAHAVVIAQAPRLAPHTAAMAAVIAGALGVDPGCVAVSATSTDGMGFTGRGEGIAASAVVLLTPLS
ncbi:MAG TPA: 2-C-methyl-D-erythritol 2,4-cyclodiphosphate synthase [Candidatus Dormibacteraeota bacterium]